MSSWADHYIEKLANGETVQFQPSGHSMEPIVKHRELCTVEPVELEDVREGDVVLCKVAGRVYFHLVKAVGDGRIQIGNNKGHVNGWTRQVYGRRVSDG